MLLELSWACLVSRKKGSYRIFLFFSQKKLTKARVSILTIIIFWGVSLHCEWESCIYTDITYFSNKPDNISLLLLMLALLFFFFLCCLHTYSTKQLPWKIYPLTRPFSLSQASSFPHISLLSHLHPFSSLAFFQAKRNMNSLFSYVFLYPKKNFSSLPFFLHFFSVHSTDFRF